MLAQLTAETTVTLSLICVVIATVGTITNLISNRKQRREITFGEEFVPKAQCQQIHIATSEAIKRHEAEIGSIWNTFRSADVDLGKQLNRMAQDLERAIGRIEGKLSDQETNFARLVQLLETRK
jgi:hypothetical protein